MLQKNEGLVSRYGSLELRRITTYRDSLESEAFSVLSQRRGGKIVSMPNRHNVVERNHWTANLG